MKHNSLSLYIILSCALYRVALKKNPNRVVVFSFYFTSGSRIGSSTKPVSGSSLHARLY